MPIERKGDSPYKGSEKLKNDLMVFLSDATTGSVKYQGFMDCMIQNQLNDRREDLINSMEMDIPSSSLMHRKSELRIVEKRIAIIENEIEQKSTRLPGYYDAYYTVWGTFDELGYVLQKEARAVCGNEEDEENYVKVEWDQTWDDIREDLQSRDHSLKPFFSPQ